MISHINLEPDFTVSHFFLSSCFMAYYDNYRAGSDPDPAEEEVAKVKKRRLHGACDACRKKKGELMLPGKYNAELKTFYYQ